MAVYRPSMDDDNKKEIKYPAWTVVSRHAWDNEGKTLRKFKPRTALMRQMVVRGLKDLENRDAPVPKLTIDMPNTNTVPPQVLASNVDTVEVSAGGAATGWTSPLCGDGVRKYLLKVDTSAVKVAMVANSFQSNNTIEEIEIDWGDGPQMFLSFYTSAQYRLWHLRFSSLNRLTSTTNFGQYMCLDKPSAIHILNLLAKNKAAAGAKQIIIGAAEKYKNDIDIENARKAAVLNGWSISFRWNTPHPDIKEKAEREPLKYVGQPEIEIR